MTVDNIQRGTGAPPVKMLATAIIAILTVTAVLAPEIGSAGPQNDQRAYCKGIYESYDSQLRCLTRETSARDRLYRRTGSFNSQVDTEIWNYCGTVYDSWESMERCITREEAAKRQLGGR